MRDTTLFGTSDELLEHLHAAQLDFVLTFQEEAWSDQLAQQLLFESPLALVVNLSSPFANRTSMSLDEIGGLRLALPVQGYSTRQFIDKAFATHRIEPTIAIEINDIPTLFQLVRTGYWHTILTMATVEGEAELKAIPIMGEGMNRQAWVVWLNKTYRKQAGVRFCELLMGTDL